MCINGLRPSYAESLFEKVGARHDRWETKGTMNRRGTASDEGVYWLPGSAQGTTPTDLQTASKEARASQDATDSARVLLYLGELDEKRGNVSRAKEWYSRARQEVEQHAPLQGMLLHHMGRITWKLGDYQAAEVEPGLLYGVVRLGERAEHPVGHRSQVAPVGLELLRQPFVFVHQ